LNELKQAALKRQPVLFSGLVNDDQDKTSSYILHGIMLKKDIPVNGCRMEMKNTVKHFAGLSVAGLQGFAPDL